MKTRVLTLFGGATTDTDNIAYVVVPRPGIITAIMGLCVGTAAINNSGGLIYEVSFASTRQVDTNDAIGPIFSLAYGHSFTTSGKCIIVTGNTLAGIAIGVRENDRLYLHADNLAGTVLANYARIHLYVAE